MTKTPGERKCLIGPKVSERVQDGGQGRGDRTAGSLHCGLKGGAVLVRVF